MRSSGERCKTHWAPTEGAGVCIGFAESNKSSYVWKKMLIATTSIFCLCMPVPSCNDWGDRKAKQKPKRAHCYLHATAAQSVDVDVFGTRMDHNKPLDDESKH